MKTKVDSTLAPERIWLSLYEGEEPILVDPSEWGEHDAVEYVRADLAGRPRTWRDRQRAEVTRSGSRVVTKRDSS